MKRMFIRLKNIIKVLLFLVGVLIMVSSLSDLLERKNAINKYVQFFDEEDDFDVLFLGTSHVVDAVYPLELWNDYGIVSYNWGGHGNQMPTNYWVLVNALDYTTPELVVVDCTCLCSNAKTSEISIEQTHVALDAFPLTENKIRAVNDLFDNNKDKASFLWKFLTYHDRWSELTEGDFAPKINLLKGAEYHIKVAVPENYEKIPREQKSSNDTLGVEYLEKIIELCQERNIEVLLTYLPFPALAYKQEEANRTYDIAAKYNIRYIDFLALDVVDYMTDCLDFNSHLNPSGGRKVTGYLGQYIMKYYDIKDRRQDDSYQSWYEDFQKGTAYKLDKIQELEELDKYLCMLSDKNIDSCIYIRADSPILNDQRMRHLLQNITPERQLEKLYEIEEQQIDGYFLLSDHSGQFFVECTDGAVQDVKTSFGVVNYSCDSMGTRELFIKNKDNNYLIQTDFGAEEPDVQIVTIDGTTGDIVHTVKFAYDIDSGVAEAELW